jgi:hypothetical protein
MTASLDPANLLPWLTVWGAVLSTGLACIKVWESFWKDRIRLATSYSFVGEGGPASTISVANLSALPVLVSSWELAWEPKAPRWWVKRVDCTPDDVSGFTID